MNAEKEEKRKQDYYAKQEEADRKKFEMELAQSRLEAEKGQRDRELEQKRQFVKENNEQLMNKRVNNYMNKMEQTDKKVAMVKSKLEHDMLVKNNMDFMREQDKQENIRRIQEMQEYRRQRLLEKINRDNDRSKIIRQEQDNMLHMKLKIRQEMEKHKEELMAKFQNKKKNRLGVTLTNSFARILLPISSIPHVYV